MEENQEEDELVVEVARVEDRARDGEQGREAAGEREREKERDVWSSIGLRDHLHGEREREREKETYMAKSKICVCIGCARGRSCP